MQTPNRLRAAMSAIAGTTGAPLAATLVTLVLSPISIAIGFNLNNFLARPILSIEYVDVVIPDSRAPRPTEEIRRLMSAPGFRSLLYNPGNQAAISPLQIAAISESEYLNRDEAERVTAATVHVERALTGRNAQLAKIQASLTATESKDEIRRLVLEMDAATVGKYRAPDLAGAELRQLALAEIALETESNENLSSLIPPVRARLAERVAENGDGVAFRISLLNRGSSDGLVLTRGRVEFADGAASIQIAQSASPEWTRPRQSAVSVREVNPQALPGVVTVGKVPSQSMVERWYSIDVEASDPDSLDRFTQVLAQGGRFETAVILSDHQQNTLRFDVPIDRR